MRVESVISSIRAARTLLLDASVDPAAAGVHFDEAERAMREDGLEPPARPTALDARNGLAHALALETQWHGRSRQEGLSPVWRRRLALAGWALVLGPVVFFMLWKGPIRGVGPWRAAFYANTKLKGDPLVRRERKIDYQWKRGPAVAELPPDKFSARFDTCLELSEPTAEAVFQLGSDDGSRLYVDGELIIDHWKNKRYKQKSATVPLAQGVHHLRLEYFENLGDARLQLAASFAGERPTHIPVPMMRYPGNRLDEEAPCGRTP